MQKLSTSFVSASEPHITDLLIRSDLAELSLNQVCKIIFDEFLSEIPAAEIVAASIKTTLAIRDYLFIKKLYAFLKPVAGIDEKQRKKMVEKIDSEEKYRVKVGEKALYLIEAAQDHSKSEMAGILFAAYLKETIDYYEYMEAAETVMAISMREIEEFIKTYKEYTPVTLEVVESNKSFNPALYNMFFNEPTVSVNDEEDYEMALSNKYRAELSDFEYYYVPSKAGIIIFSILSNYFDT